MISVNILTSKQQKWSKVWKNDASHFAGNTESLGEGNAWKDEFSDDCKKTRRKRCQLKAQIQRNKKQKKTFLNTDTLKNRQTWQERSGRTQTLVLPPGNQSQQVGWQPVGNPSPRSAETYRLKHNTGEWMKVRVFLKHS